MRNPYSVLFGQEPTQLISRITEVTRILHALCTEPFAPQIFMLTGL